MWPALCRKFLRSIPRCASAAGTGAPLSDPGQHFALDLSPAAARARRHAHGGRRCGFRGSVRGRRDFAGAAQRRAGRALPRVFFAGEASLPDAARRYRRAYKQSLLPVFRASSKIRRMLVLPGSVRKPVLLFLWKAVPPSPTTWCARHAEASVGASVLARAASSGTSGGAPLSRRGLGTFLHC